VSGIEVGCLKADELLLELSLPALEGRIVPLPVMFHLFESGSEATSASGSWGRDLAHRLDLLPQLGLSGLESAHSTSQRADRHIRARQRCDGTVRVSCSRANSVVWVP